MDLLRRLLLAAVNTWVDNPQTSHKVMVSITIFLLLLQALAAPFTTSKANVVEVSLLFSLSIITFLSSPNMTWTDAVAIETVFFISTLLLVCHMIWEDGKLKNWKKPPTPQPGYRVPALGEEDDGTMLRDPLLAEQVPDITTTDVEEDQT